ncbi:uncharacterized protein LOC142172605 [Nicotiana tabacum]|uniref:Uncharacterized protein LOC142172605 n=1 Tax=Nicotiana tabacum TaxID=4097 RepID=A0AC58T557_TOBAC
MVLDLTPTSSPTSTTILPNTSLDPSHPLYVHVSDNPGVTLVTVPFSSTGYVSWRKNVLIALSAKNKTGMVNGRITQSSPDSPLYDHRLRCNNMLINNRLSTDLWKDVDERYGQSNASRYYQIQREIGGVSQGSSDIASYYTRSNILMMIHVPSLSKAHSMLLHDESQREVQVSRSPFLSESTSFHAKCTLVQNTSTNKSYSQKISFENKRSNIVCKYCRKPGHSVDKCYRLHGFPHDFKFTKGQKVVACVQLDDPRTDSFSAPEALPGSPVHGFSKEQYQHLMSLFQQSQISAATQNPSIAFCAMGAFASVFCRFAVYYVALCCVSQLKVNT